MRIASNIKIVDKGVYRRVMNFVIVWLERSIMMYSVLEGLRQRCRM